MMSVWLLAFFPSPEVNDTSQFIELNPGWKILMNKLSPPTDIASTAGRPEAFIGQGNRVLGVQ